MPRSAHALLASIVALTLLFTACGRGTTDKSTTATAAPADQMPPKIDLTLGEAVIQASRALENIRWDTDCRNLAGSYLNLVAETILDSEGMTPAQLREAEPPEALISTEQQLTDEFNRLGCSQVHYDIDVLQQIANLDPDNATEVAIIAKAMGGTTDRLGTESVGLVHLIIELPQSGFIINPVKLEGPEPTNCDELHQDLLDTYQAAVEAASFATDDPRVPLNMGEAMEGDATFFNAVTSLNQSGRVLGCDAAEINLYILDHHADLEPSGFWGLAFKWSVLFGAAGGA